MKIDEIKQIYSDFAETYEADLKNAMKYKAYRTVAQSVIKELKAGETRILDLGCGTGLSSLLFLKKGYEVTGIDGTQAMIKKARRLPYKKIICQDLEADLKVKDESFDAVVMIGVMEHINNPGALFKQVIKKLNVDGLFGLTVPKKSRWYTKSNLKSYHKKEIEPILLKSGFTIMKCERILGIEEEGNTVNYWSYLLRKG